MRRGNVTSVFPLLNGLSHISLHVEGKHDLWNDISKVCGATAVGFAAFYLSSVWLDLSWGMPSAYHYLKGFPLPHFALRHTYIYLVIHGCLCFTSGEYVQLLDPASFFSIRCIYYECTWGDLHTSTRTLPIHIYAATSQLILSYTDEP
jgi:hypothetical protein